MRHPHGPWISALALLGIGCAATPPDDAAWLTLHPDDAVASGRLIGWNIGRGTLYGTDGDPLHPAWRSDERTAAVTRLAEVRTPTGPAPWMRFSGLQIDGTLGEDGYHFWDFADPGHSPAAGDNMAPFQYMALIEDAGADPLVTLNFGSGTAGEAADYVTHLVGTDAADPLVEARSDWGRDAPWAPGAFEIGNEVYGFWNTGYTASGDYAYANPDAAHGGDPEWHGHPSADPADFAARALAYVEAVTAVAPDARFWVPLAQADLDWWGGARGDPDAAGVPRGGPAIRVPPDARRGVRRRRRRRDDGGGAAPRPRREPFVVVGGPGRLVRQRRAALCPAGLGRRRGGRGRGGRGGPPGTSTAAPSRCWRRPTASWRSGSSDERQSPFTWITAAPSISLRLTARSASLTRSRG